MTPSTLSPAPPTSRWATPSVEYAPPGAVSVDARAIALARDVGMTLLPWQEHALRLLLRKRIDDVWACREFGLVVSRQNGKGEVIQARELAGLFLFGERIVHSAHEFATSLDAFRRLKDVIESSAILMARMKRNRNRGMTEANGKQSIELESGARLDYRARHKGGAGRGLTGDLIVFDEAMYLPESVLGAIAPLISSRAKAQILYAGSAVDQAVHDEGHVFARVRRRAQAGDARALGYLEWGSGLSLPEAVTRSDDEDVWAAANPSYPGLIGRDAILTERDAMDPRSFAVERLGVGDWPEPDDAPNRMIAPQAWASLADRAAEMLDPVVLAVDVTPNRSHCAIAAAGARPDGLVNAQLVDHHPGANWAPARIAELCDEREVREVRLDRAGATATLEAPLREILKGKGVKLVMTGPQDMAKACSAFQAAVIDRTVRHPASDAHPRGAVEVDAALKGAVARQIGDAWAWARRTSRIDISPLVAVTLAHAAIAEPAAAQPVPFFDWVT